MEWRNIEIEGLAGIYQVSDSGLVRSIDRTVFHSDGRAQHRKGVVLKPGHSKGYPVVVLSNKEATKTFLVHRLVAEAFIPNPEHKKEVNHIDGNKTNNNISNLEWVTKMETMHHAIKTGLLTKEMMRESAQRGKRFAIKNQSKRVGKFLDGSLVDDYYSVHEAVRQNNYKSRSPISMCCNNKSKTAYGYEWKFI